MQPSGDGMEPSGDAIEPSNEPIVRVSCVRHVYPDRTQVHLCGLDFEVERGQRAVILGPNGSGKSTLLYHILGLLEPQEGVVTVLGVHPARDFAKIRERVGVLLQNVDDQIVAPTVWDDVSYSPRSYGHSEADVAARVTAALSWVGIEHLRHKVCHHLSGGERRKVALAGMLALDPELLVLDEPFEGLDPASRTDLRDLLNRLHRERGVTLIMATHDVNVVPSMADRVFLLRRGGEIVARGTPRDVFGDARLLQRSNIEPPVLAELFERLAELGHDLGRPLDIEEAARLLMARLGPASLSSVPASPPSGKTSPSSVTTSSARSAQPAPASSSVPPHPAAGP